MSEAVRFPEAYRRLYWRILDALDASPIEGSYHDDEAEAQRRTTAVLALFDERCPDQGEDWGPAGAAVKAADG